MSTIVTRAGKGSALTHTEMDANVTNLNNDKYQSGDSPAFGTITATGNITAYYSDERLKTFQGTVSNALAKVMSLNGYFYVPNEKAQELGYDTIAVELGVSAQEVEKVVPEVVSIAPISEFADTTYLTVHYERLVPLLIEAIKELKSEVEDLKNGTTN